MIKLKIAITKGRLLEDAIQLFSRSGLDMDRVKSPGRRLIVDIPNYPLQVVLAKAADVITYVEHGVCDMGIVGKDTILEYGGSFIELLDLSFGFCRFALAVRKGFDFYSGFTSRRIASKYPNVARSFFLSKGMDVSVIKIEGSVELAPLLGLSDAIVDIVQSGATLDANGLEPIEFISDISARLIANSAAMKLYKKEILELTSRCREVIKETSYD